MNEGDAEQLAERLVAAVERSRAADADEEQRLQAIAAAAARLRQLMARVPWAVVSPHWLEGIQNAYDPVIATVESFGTTDDSTQPFLVTWGEIDRLWSSLAPLVPAGIPEESVSEDAATFRRSTGQMTRRLAEQVESIESQIGEVRAGLDTLAAERDGALRMMREQQESLEVTIQEQSGRLDTAIAQYESQFADQQAKHQSELQAAIGQSEQELKTYFASWQTIATDIVEGTKGRAEELLASITDLEAKATKSYNTIGTASVAGYYQADADKEQTQARLWRGLAAAAFLLVAAATILELALSGGSLEWEQTRSRLPVIIGLFGFSAFAVSEARGHRRAEREARGREVKLSSIDPYLVLVGDDTAASEVKVEFARALFIESGSLDEEGGRSDAGYLLGKDDSPA